MPLALPRHLICLVTDRRRLLSSGPLALVEFVGAAASAGVDLIHIRERDLEARALTDLVARCVDAASGARSRIIVNERADVALAAGAHGVHLRGDSIQASRIRELVPSDFIVGRSVHGVEDAGNAVRGGGLDYLTLGTLFATASKSPAHGLTPMTDLATVCRLSPIPVLAIGGMTVERAEEVARLGAAGLCAIGLFVTPAEVSAVTHLRDLVTALRRVFDTCGAVP